MIKVVDFDNEVFSSGMHSYKINDLGKSLLGSLANATNAIRVLKSRT